VTELAEGDEQDDVALPPVQLGQGVEELRLEALGGQ
jgi:hypothetical protein